MHNQVFGCVKVELVKCIQLCLLEDLVIADLVIGLSWLLWRQIKPNFIGYIHLLSLYVSGTQINKYLANKLSVFFLIINTKSANTLNPDTGKHKCDYVEHKVRNVH